MMVKRMGQDSGSVPHQDILLGGNVICGERASPVECRLDQADLGAELKQHINEGAEMAGKGRWIGRECVSPRNGGVMDTFTYASFVIVRIVGNWARDGSLQDRRPERHKPACFGRSLAVRRFPGTNVKLAGGEKFLSRGLPERGVS